MIYDGTRFVIASDNDIYSTVNGENFDLMHFGKSGNAIAFDGNIYVTVGNKGEIGTLVKGAQTIVHSKQLPKSTSGFVLRQNGKVLKIISPIQSTRPLISIYNITGKKQKIKPAFNADGSVSISVSHLAAGLYILDIKVGKENWQKQIVVK
jgi:hypothetical protein